MHLGLFSRKLRIQFLLETLDGNQQWIEILSSLSTQLFCVEWDACFSCQLERECWKAGYRTNWQVSIDQVALVEAVSNLDMKVGSVYWRMQQCRELGQPTQALGHECVQERGIY